MVDARDILVQNYCRMGVVIGFFFMDFISNFLCLVIYYFNIFNYLYLVFLILIIFYSFKVFIKNFCLLSNILKL